MPLTRIKTTAIDHVFLSEFLGTVASESAMLALVGGIGDYAVRSDLNNDSFIITQNNGSSIGDWQKISNTSTALLKSENLNDLPDAGTARSNLGLGTASTTASTDYATAAQGTKADSALQPTNNLNDLSNAGTALDNLGFSAFGKSIIDDADAAAVRTTLGLGEAATSDTLGGSQDFTVTGTLANGDIVGLRSDGTVEKVFGEYYSGAPVVFESDTISEISTTFDSNSNKVVIAYKDSGNLNYGTAVVGTVSGDTITFGTPVVFESAQTEYISATFDSNSNKVVIAYKDVPSGNGNGTAIVGTVSGDTITFGASVIFKQGNTAYVSATFDSNTNKVVIAYQDNDTGFSGAGVAIVGTVSGNSITFGTPTVFETGDTDYISATFDSNTNKVVIAYRDKDNSSHGTAAVGTVSGTSITFGTPVVFEDNPTYYCSATFDSNTNKVVIAYQDNNNSTRGTAVVGNVAGTTISFGTPVVFESGTTSDISATFDSNTNKVVIAYRDVSNSGHGTAAVGTVSGTSITFGTPVVFESDTSDWFSATFDSNTNKVVIAYQDSYNSNYGTAAVFNANATVTPTNADTWIGIADGTSGTVKIIGGVAEGLTGLTTGAIYYVKYDGTLTSTEIAGFVNGTYGKIGRAISSTQLFITEGNA